MEQKVSNFRIIIEPEKMGKRIVYNAYCPSLGIADYGDTVEDVLASIKEGIELAVECLQEKNEPIPVDNIDEQFITAVKVSTHFTPSL